MKKDEYDISPQVKLAIDQAIKSGDSKEVLIAWLERQLPSSENGNLIFQKCKEYIERKFGKPLIEVLGDEPDDGVRLKL